MGKTAVKIVRKNKFITSIPAATAQPTTAQSTVPQTSKFFFQFFGVSIMIIFGF